MAREDRLAYKQSGANCSVAGYATMMRFQVLEDKLTSHQIETKGAYFENYDSTNATGEDV